MCSWCYGFEPQLHQLIEHYKSKINFTILMGGLRPGGGTPWDQKMKDFLRHHWEEVEKKTGQIFKYNLLTWDSFNYDTEPACRAIVVIRDLIPKKVFPFYKFIQKQFYLKNEDPNDLNFYLTICDDLEISKDEFTKRFYSEEYKNKTIADFKDCGQFGVRGFPSLIFIDSNNEYHVISGGYSTFDLMKERIDRLS